MNSEESITTNTGITVTENDLANPISQSDLETTDIDHTPSELTYTITDAADLGTLRRNGVALSVNSTFTQDDINSGRIDYSHSGAEGISDAFTFTVDDGVGTVSTGTFNITITPVNDNTPTITSDGGGGVANLTVNENQTAVTTVQATDADLPAETLTYSVIGGDDRARSQSIHRPARWCSFPHRTANRQPISTATMSLM